jgi:glycosyltransferase involved in cell wall biosynthesis
LAKLPISVLIDTYNHERFIEKSINSVLEQGFPVTGREIIVVDDGSTDRTPQIVKRFEAHLQYIRKENGGQASAFNVGIPECWGEIIAFLDGDDYALRFMGLHFLCNNIASRFHDNNAGAVIIC